MRTTPTDGVRSSADAWTQMPRLPSHVLPSGAVGCGTLSPVPIVQEYLKAFYDTTGVRVRLVEGEAAPLTVKGAGPTVMVMPVFARRRHIASFVSEEIAFQNQGDTSVNAAFGLPQLTERRRRGMQQLLAIFSRLLAEVADRYRLAQTDGEPAPVAKAKAFIRAHKCDEININQVAGHVHLSPGYFGKCFQKATGMTFTEYVTRVRVESTKELLANRSRRVSEVAFEAGFQSLAHFNHSFKAHTGASPSQYRASLHSKP